MVEERSDSLDIVKMNNSTTAGDYAKEQPPDIIKNLLDEAPEVKKCEKRKFKDKSTNIEHLADHYKVHEEAAETKKISEEEKLHDPRAPGKLTSLSHTGQLKQRRKRRVIRGLFWVGWFVCCPCFVLGKCLRESPEPEDDDEHEDPCLPWKYKV